jgi:hypothetical protein
MYLPKSKYTVKITKGGDFYKKDGSTYRGKYIETYNGQIFTGGELTPASEKLEDFRYSASVITNFSQVAFKSDMIKPTKEDYKEGFITRYYVQDIRNKAIIEANKENYKGFLTLPYLKTLKLKWNLKGPAENVNKGPYIYFGAISKNKELVLEGEKTIEGLSEFIFNYGEFVV